MKYLLFILTVSGLVASCTERSSYTITGSDPSFVDGQYMFVLDGTKWNPLDSAIIENSSFRIKGNSYGCGVAYLYMGKNSSDTDLVQTGGQFFLEKGRISMDKDFRFTGTPLNDRYSALLDTIAWQTGDGGTSAVIENTIRENRNLLGLTLCRDLLRYKSRYEIIRLLDEFPEDIRQNPVFTEINGMIEAAKVDVGDKYLDFAGVTISGDKTCLGETIGRPDVRYVLLDFWATWCGPCREEIPYLKGAYGKFRKKGLEIFGMSFDMNVQKWKDYIESENLAWINIISENPPAPRENRVWTDYGLDGIPWNYIIDTETGKIIAKNLRGDALEKKLSELMPE